MTNDAYISSFAKRLGARLERIYGVEKTQDLLERLLTVLEPSYARDPAQRHCRLWDEHDVVLITYGDSICTENEFPLVTLRNFLANEMAGLVGVVHLLPFFPYSSDDGFAVIDYECVNPELGDWQHIEALGEQFDLMFDLVINHVSSQHRWFQQFLRNQPPGSDYFVVPSDDADLTHVVRPRQSALLTEVETDAGPRKVWTTFSADQVDVDFSNPDVLLEYLRILLLYLQKGARLLRLDAVAFLWKEAGTGCLNLPQTHEIVKLLRDLLTEITPRTVLLTETNLPHHQNLSYFGDSDEAHMIYQFSLAPLLLHALFRGTSNYLCNWARTRCVAPPGCTFLNFTASHDGIGMRPLEGLLPQGEIDLLIRGMEKAGGLVSYKANSDGSKSPYEINVTYFDALKGTWLGDDSWQIARFLLAQTLMLGLRGIPAVYIHSLLATPNDLDGVKRTGRARSINRRRWRLDELEPLLADPQSNQAIVFRELRRRLVIRKRQPAFHPDARQEIVPLGDHLFGFWRQSLDGRQRIFVVHNLTDQLRTLYLDGALDGVFHGQWIGLLTGEEVTGSRAVIDLPPYHVLWLTQVTC